MTTHIHGALTLVTVLFLLPPIADLDMSAYLSDALRHNVMLATIQSFDMFASSVVDCVATLPQPLTTTD